MVVVYRCVVSSDRCSSSEDCYDHNEFCDRITAQDRCLDRRRKIMMQDRCCDRRWARRGGTRAVPRLIDKGHLLFARIVCTSWGVERQSDVCR